MTQTYTCLCVCFHKKIHPPPPINFLMIKTQFDCKGVCTSGRPPMKLHNTQLISVSALQSNATINNAPRMISGRMIGTPPPQTPPHSHYYETSACCSWAHRTEVFRNSIEVDLRSCILNG